MAEYSQEDLQAWRDENPWDHEIPDEVITDWFGFQVFVLGRRSAELGGTVREQFEALMEKIDQYRLDFIRRWWNS